MALAAAPNRLGELTPQTSTGTMVGTIQVQVQAFVKDLWQTLGEVWGGDGWAVQLGRHWVRYGKGKADSPVGRGMYAGAYSGLRPAQPPAEVLF